MKIKKTIIYSLLTLQMLIVFAPTMVSAQAMSYNTTIVSAIPSRADDIDWQYKMEGNILYRRLYNYSTNTPLSDWEACL